MGLTNIRGFKQLIYLITRLSVVCINSGFNAHFVCYIFNLFVLHLQV